jgi:chromosome segregation ATPase
MGMKKGLTGGVKHKVEHVDEPIPDLRLRRSLIPLIRLQDVRKQYAEQELRGATRALEQARANVSLARENLQRISEEARSRRSELMAGLETLSFSHSELAKWRRELDGLRDAVATAGEHLNQTQVDERKALAQQQEKQAQYRIVAVKLEKLTQFLESEEHK